MSATAWKKSIPLLSLASGAVISHAVFLFLTLNGDAHDVIHAYLEAFNFEWVFFNLSFLLSFVGVWPLTTLALSLFDDEKLAVNTAFFEPAHAEIRSV